ncbi:hypothetical protein Pan5_70 [Pseudanabaena phage Pan5]|nr:hypothetical protein Pan5_70 [Pseudanabaena phage Pan5]
MTLHDQLNIILIQYRAGKGMEEEGGYPDPTPDTISAIIQAVTERLPGEMGDHPYRAGLHYGWNAYREEVRKVLEVQ